jgi:hypothetical protein
VITSLYSSGSAKPPGTIKIVGLSIDGIERKLRNAVVDTLNSGVLCDYTNEVDGADDDDDDVMVRKGKGELVSRGNLTVSIIPGARAWGRSWIIQNGGD